MISFVNVSDSFVRNNTCLATQRGCATSLQGINNNTFSYNVFNLTSNGQRELTFFEFTHGNNTILRIINLLFKISLIIILLALPQKQDSLQLIIPSLIMNIFLLITSGMHLQRNLLVKGLLSRRILIISPMKNSL